MGGKVILIYFSFYNSIIQLLNNSINILLKHIFILLFNNFVCFSALQDYDIPELYF